ncbi:MAG: hypothetical protein WAT68_12305 [Candidatus Nitrotoga sp.]
MRSVNKLLDTLFNATNDVWRDDAAEELGDCSDLIAAQEALFFAIESGQLDNSLRRTCAESLAKVWISRGYVKREELQRLKESERFIAEAFLRAANLLPAINN